MYNENVKSTFREDLAALVLAALETESMHGYEIAKTIRTKSDDALRVSESKLYPALHELEFEELISANWIGQGNRPPKKVYSLTENGRKLLTQKRKEWSQFSNAVGSLMQPKVSSI